MLVVEGPDLVGKTTLCEELVARLNADGWAERTCGAPSARTHFGPLPDGWDYLGGYARLVRPGAVMDRFHWSERAYGGALRGGSKIDPRRTAIVDGLIHACGGMIVLVCPPFDAYAKLLDQRWTNREMFDKMQLELVRLRFMQMSNSCDALHSCVGMTGFRSRLVNPAEDETWLSGVVTEYKKRTELATSLLGKIT